MKNTIGKIQNRIGNDGELTYWVNQHGQGIIFRGKTLRILKRLSKRTGKTIKVLFNEAIDRYLKVYGNRLHTDK